MSEEGFQEKTERATPRKRQKAKEKGQVARSRDLSSMSAMGGIILIFYFAGEYFFRSLMGIMSGVLSFQFGSDVLRVSQIATIQGMKVIAPFLVIPVFLVIAASVLQGGFVLKPLKFEMEKLNPVNGITRIFSIKGLSELLKSIIKFSIGSWLVYYIISRDIHLLPSLSAMEMNEMVRVSARMILEAVTIAFLFYLAVSFMSYALDKWQYERSLRMTKQEIKEEVKEMEGDPLIKSRIRSMQREAARRRMMQEVPGAAVVITNPTHLAVALKYEDGGMIAPKIAAKGAGIVAEKIKEIAREHNVPIVEDKPLARALFKLELDSFIPEELYVAVAKILAYIYKLKGKI